MSVAGKHAYRFGYLKSEQWQNVRAAVLARDKAKCFMCDQKDISNDIHHWRYPESVWDTSPDDCITLCRICHQRMHELLDKKITWGEIVRLTLMRILLKLFVDLNMARKKKRKSVRGTSICRICNFEDKLAFLHQPVTHDTAMLPICDGCWSYIIQIPEPRTWGKISKLRKNFR